MAWFLTYGRWPQNTIDHINRVKTDNRLLNLRDVSQEANSRNMPRVTKLQVIGPVRQGDSWAVVLPEYLDSRTIGPFPTPEEAHAVFLVEMEKCRHKDGRARPKLRLENIGSNFR